jgi:hypothetical protein
VTIRHNAAFLLSKSAKDERYQNCLMMVGQFFKLSHILIDPGKRDKALLVAQKLGIAPDALQ